MRWMIAALFMVIAFACTEHGSRPPDAGGNPSIDAAGACAPSGLCAQGPPCGPRCCGLGERCEAGVCVCGSQAACEMGDTCETGGPIGGDPCGTICCGATTPCPL